MKSKKSDTSLCLLAALILSPCGALAADKVDADTKHQLSRPDDNAADQTKKVKVFILMGQSNMVGMGDINPADKPGTRTTLRKTEKTYRFLVDDAGQWTVRKEVFYYAGDAPDLKTLTAQAEGGELR